MKLVVGLALAVVVSGCVAEGDESPYGGGGSGGQNGDLGAEVQAIFDRTCAGSGCHGGENPAAGLSLEPGVAFEQLIDVPGVTCAGDRVEPGNPEASCLWQFVETDVMPPRPFDPLSADEKGTIEAWILSLEPTGSGGAGGAGGTGGGGEGGAGGSGVGGGGGSDETVTFAQIQAVFDASCVSSCHTGSTPRGGLNLTSGKSYDQLVDIPCDATSDRVDPGNPGNSCLWHLVDAGTMPPAPRADLSAAQKDLIFRWIEQGANR